MTVSTGEVNRASILVITVVRRVELLAAVVILDHIASNLENLLHMLQAEEIADRLTFRISIADLIAQSEPRIRTVQVLMSSLHAQNLSLECVQSRLVLVGQCPAFLVADRRIRAVCVNVRNITLSHFSIYIKKLNTISITPASIPRSSLQHQQGTQALTR